MILHCFRCGGVLSKKSLEYFDCKKCKYRHYMNPVPSNSLILENEKGEILLVKRKFNPKKNFWDLPGGFIKLKETLEESVKREVKEELGINVKKMTYLGSYTDKYLYQKIVWNILAFSFYTKMPKQKILIGDDITEYRFFSKDKVPYKMLGFKGLKLAIDKFFEIKK